SLYTASLRRIRGSQCAPTTNHLTILQFATLAHPLPRVSYCYSLTTTSRTFRVIGCLSLSGLPCDPGLGSSVPNFSIHQENCNTRASSLAYILRALFSGMRRSTTGGCSDHPILLETTWRSWVHVS